MDSDIFILLLQDGLTTGAIYVLLAIGLLIVFSVTRVILIPQGDFVAYGALGMASLIDGHVPGTLWLLDGCAVVVAVPALFRLRGMARAARRGLVFDVVYPALLTLAVLAAVRFGAPPLVLGVLAVGITAPLGPYVYRLAFAPVARASVLTLLIVSMAVHYVLLGIGLLAFGPEGSRTPAFSTASFQFGTVDVSGHSLWVAGTCIALVGVLRWMFGRTLYGKALRAAASDPFGARLMGISAATTGRLSFLLAALIGALAGLLIAPITPVYYDTGFAIGLKGFVAAIIGGLASYPLAAVGALLVGVVESFVGFSFSSYREAIVFALIIPVLLWLSLRRSTPGA